MKKRMIKKNVNKEKAVEKLSFSEVVKVIEKIQRKVEKFNEQHPTPQDERLLRYR